LVLFLDGEEVGYWVWVHAFSMFLLPLYAYKARKEPFLGVFKEHIGRSGDKIS
jgi:hypothetical protein